MYPKSWSSYTTCDYPKNSTIPVLHAESVCFWIFCWKDHTWWQLETDEFLVDEIRRFQNLNLWISKFESANVNEIHSHLSQTLNRETS